MPELNEGETPKSMDVELLAAMQKVVDYLDRQMEVNPNRDLADCSNYLQSIIDHFDKEA